MGDTIIAVAGTLLGGLLTVLLQSRHSQAARRDDRAERRAADLRAARCYLVAAIGDHRRTMWHREHLRLTGAPQQDYDTARAASHATRSAVTAPLVAVSILEPELEPAARRRPGPPWTCAAPSTWTHSPPCACTPLPPPTTSAAGRVLRATEPDRGRDRRRAATGCLLTELVS